MRTRIYLSLGRRTAGMMTAKICQHTNLLIAVGFGISNPDQAKIVAANAEAIVVGSAIVNQITANGKSPDRVPNAIAFVKTLADGVKARK